MTQQRSGRDEDAPGGVTGTGDGTGGSLGTSSGDTGAAGAYCDQLLNTPEFLEWERDATAETQAD